MLTKQEVSEFLCKNIHLTMKSMLIICRLGLVKSLDEVMLLFQLKFNLSDWCVKVTKPVIHFFYIGFQRFRIMPRFVTLFCRITDILKEADVDLEEEDEEEDRKQGGKKKKKILQCYLHEGKDDDVEDFLDPATSRKIVCESGVSVLLSALLYLFTMCLKICVRHGSNLS